MGHKNGDRGRISATTPAPSGGGDDNSCDIDLGCNPFHPRKLREMTSELNLFVAPIARGGSGVEQSPLLAIRHGARYSSQDASIVQWTGPSHSGKEVWYRDDTASGFELTAYCGL